MNRISIIFIFLCLFLSSCFYIPKKTGCPDCKDIHVHYEINTDNYDFLKNLDTLKSFDYSAKNGEKIKFDVPLITEAQAVDSFIYKECGECCAFDYFWWSSKKYRLIDENGSWFINYLLYASKENKSIKINFQTKNTEVEMILYEDKGKTNVCDSLFETLTLNNISFKNVYMSSNEQNDTIYFTYDLGVIGFSHDGLTYLLDNI